MDIAKFVSLYLDGKAAEPMSGCEGITDISLGDTVFGDELSWVQDGDRLIADRCVCSIVSWDHLNEIGYICGRPAKIDGKPYRCRCLTGGAQMGDSNEWDDLVAKYGADDDLWHGNLQYFWCQEKRGPHKKLAVVRGIGAPGPYNAYGTKSETPFIGFRPVLEPLPPMPDDLSPLVGKQVRIYVPQGRAFTKELAAVNEYDISIAYAGKLPDGCDWAVREGKQITISKDKLLWLEET